MPVKMNEWYFSKRQRVEESQLWVVCVDTSLLIMHHLGMNMLSYMQRWRSVPLHRPGWWPENPLVSVPTRHYNVAWSPLCFLTILFGMTHSSHITFLLNVSSVLHCFAESLMMMIVDEIWLERVECLMTSTETETAVCGSECLTGPLTWIPSKGHTQVIPTDTNWVKS